MESNSNSIVMGTVIVVIVIAIAIAIVNDVTNPFTLVQVMLGCSWRLAWLSAPASVEGRKALILAMP